MNVCFDCKRKCEYRNKGFENVTLYCKENCALELKRECDEIATEEFRKMIKTMEERGYKTASVKGILKQAHCILNVADNKIISL